MSSSNSVSYPGRVEAKARPIALHQSALTQEEYDYYMAALSDLSSQNSDKAPQDHMEEMDQSTYLVPELKVITLREARAWLRGWFHSVPSAMVDKILLLFPSPLTGERTLTGAQFLATLRLMCHAQNGMTELDKNLTFKPASIPVLISSGTIKLQDEGKEESACDTLDLHSVPKPRAKFGPEVMSNSAAKPSSKLKPEEQSQDSDEDPNKTETDDSEAEEKTMQKPKTTPSRLAATALGAEKLTIKPATRSTYTARSKKVKGKQMASDGFSRPPPNKDGTYLIDRITASHTSPTGAVELNVVWEGYPESEGTWEPLAEMKETEAYARWMAMWVRLRKKGIKDVQIVNNMRKVSVVNGKKEEHKLVQAVGTNVNKARWVPVKEAREMMGSIKEAILEDERMMAGRA